VIQTPGTLPTYPTDPNPADYRTLVSNSSDYRLTGNWTKALGDAGTALTINGTAERNDGRSLSGLNTVDLTDPAGDVAVRTFGADFPLATRTQTDTYSFGSTLNAHAGTWQLTGTIDASHADATTKIDRRILAGPGTPLQDLIDQARAGTFALDAPITGFTYPGYDTAESKTDSATTKFTAMGNPIHLPAGEVGVTFDAGFDWNRINSTDTRNGSQTKLTRGDLNGGINLSIPITAQDSAIGKVTANLSGGLDHYSDFGTLKNWSAGLNWGPTDKLNFQGNYVVRDAPPGLSQLGAPTVLNYNVPVYDFNTDQTVLTTVLTGGNPSLKRETDRDLHLSASYNLPLFDRSNIRVEYFSNNSDDVSSAFPLLTPAVEAAFPGRVTRDAFGNITSIDERPVTFYNEKSSRVRFGIFLGGRIGSSSQQGGGRAGGRGGAGGPPPGDAGAGGPPPEGGPPGGGAFFGGANGARSNFNPQAFADFRAKLCDPKASTPPDLSALPEQMRARLLGEDGKPDPQKLAAMKERVCSGNGGRFNPQAFAQLRQTFCPADKAVDLTKLPAQVLDRFKGADGQVDQARLTQFRTRVCSVDPAQFAARQGQQAQGGAAAGGQAPQGNAPAAGQPAQRSGGGGARGGGSARGGGGPGSFFMNRGRNNGGRWNLSLTDTIELTNTVQIAPGGPVLDQLHGDAVSGNGVARNTLTLEGGAFYNGLGLRFNGSYKSGTDVTGTGLPGSSDLHFGSLFTLDLRVFADLGRQAKLVKAVPFFKNSTCGCSPTSAGRPSWSRQCHSSRTRAFRSVSTTCSTRGSGSPTRTGSFRCATSRS
jgi:hypothetical protein